MDFKECKKIFLEYLQEKIKDNQMSYEEFKEAIDEYKKLALDIEKIIQFAAKNSVGDKKEKIWNLYYDFSRENVAEMCDRLNKLGYAIRKDEEYKNVVLSFQDHSFKIMEKVRHALRSEVEYMIMRIFVADKKQIPLLISQVFNPVYSDEIFKVFIYSFLNGILGEEKTKQGGEE